MKRLFKSPLIPVVLAFSLAVMASGCGSDNPNKNDQPDHAKRQDNPPPGGENNDPKKKETQERNDAAKKLALDGTWQLAELQANPADKQPDLARLLDSGFEVRLLTLGDQGTLKVDNRKQVAATQEPLCEIDLPLKVTQSVTCCGHPALTIKQFPVDQLNISENCTNHPSYNDVSVFILKLVVELESHDFVLKLLEGDKTQPAKIQADRRLKKGEGEEKKLDFKIIKEGPHPSQAPVSVNSAVSEPSAN